MSLMALIHPERSFTRYSLVASRKTASLDFLVIDEMPVDVIISSPTLEPLEAKLDMRHRYVTVKINETWVQLAFEYERTQTTAAMPDHTDNYDLSSSSGEEGGGRPRNRTAMAMSIFSG